VLDMRVEDPNGAWRPHPEERKLLIRREPIDSPADGPFYRLLAEGRIENYDGVTIKVPPPLEGLDLNRNFPAEWAPEHEQRGAGPYPTSEPEVRAMVQAVTERPNITGYIAYHTFSGVHLRPYAGRPDDDFPTPDLRAYNLIGERGTALTGYPAVSVFHDFKYEPKQTIKGSAHDWMYDHLGVFSWTTEFWSPQRQAGLSDYHFTDWIRDHPIEDDVKLIEWAKKNYPDAYVDWYEFDHPELGKVELGGWDIINYWFNVPFDRLEDEVAPHSEWALFHLLVSPLLEVRALEVEKLGESSFLVRLVLQNSGWLPTNVTEKALERKTVREVEVEVELPDGARLVGGEVKTEAGQLKGEPTSAPPPGGRTTSRRATSPSSSGWSRRRPEPRSPSKHGIRAPAPCGARSRWSSSRRKKTPACAGVLSSTVVLEETYSAYEAIDAIMLSTLLDQLASPQLASAQLAALQLAAAQLASAQLAWAQEAPVWRYAAQLAALNVGAPVIGSLLTNW
jgi:hypothetical protein